MSDAPAICRVGDFELVWGESLRWDDVRGRLYFVDCARNSLHWLDAGAPPLRTLTLGSLPTGIALTTGGRLVVCLDEGLCLVDPDAGTTELLAAYPEGLHGRANDLGVDPAGNLVTGTLRAGPGPGSLWRFSAGREWTRLDEGTGNTNGPVVTALDGKSTLVVGDTVAAAVHVYTYEPEAGTVGPRRLLADYGGVGGAPDGATVDGDGVVWSCVLGRGAIAQLTPTSTPAPDIENAPSGANLDLGLRLPSRNPSDVTFGGPELDRLFVTSIAVDLGNGAPTPESSHLLEVRGVGATGRPEYRFAL